MKKPLYIICLVLVTVLTVGYAVSYLFLEEDINNVDTGRNAMQTEEESDYVQPVDAENELVMHENIDSEDEERYEYYIVLKNNLVYVYYANSMHLFLDTKITKDELQEEDVKSLQNGLYVKSIWDVYHFLESYTS